MATEMWVCELGAIDYRSALRIQEDVRALRQQDLVPDTLLLVEHSPAVYTRGRRSTPDELTMGEAWYADRGIEIIETRRGGKVTYHGPGQLVGYPVARVDDVLAYVRLLERALITALREVDVDARAREDEGPAFTGVWVQDRKIASIGVHVARGVAIHGFAINVQARALEPFGWVVPCGLPDVRMTSIETERGDDVVTVPRFAELATTALADALGHTPRAVEATQIGRGFEPASVAGTSTPRVSTL